MEIHFKTGLKAFSKPLKITVYLKPYFFSTVLFLTSYFMKKLALQHIAKEPETINSHTPLLILLHGYGSNEQDLFSFSSELPEEALIISARAPQNLGMGGYAWYTINFDATGGKFSDTEEAKTACKTIATFITQLQEKYSITSEKTFLIGFSQGCILSCAVALNYPEKTQKVVGLSGYILSDILPKNLSEKDYSKLDFFISHGTADQVIPVDWARKISPFLKQLNIKHQYKEYPVGHGVSPQNFYDFKQWITNKI